MEIAATLDDAMVDPRAAINASAFDRSLAGLTENFCNRLIVCDAARRVGSACMRAATV